MQYDPKNSIKIALADVGVGMFVTAIEHNKRVNLANAGRISSPEGIKKLTASGVKYVWVDQTLSSQKCVFKPVDESIVAVEEEREPKSSDFSKVQRAYRSRDVQHKRAKKLIAEAKDLAQKLLNQTFEGKIIEVDEVEAWADDVIESVFIDSDALQCVSAL